MYLNRIYHNFCLKKIFPSLCSRQAYRPFCFLLLATALAFVFTPSAQAAEPVTSVHKTEPTLRQFGAKCDGVTNDSKALLAYAEYCAENGKPFIIPQGTTVLAASHIIIRDLKNIQVLGTITAPNGIEFWANSKRNLNTWFFNIVKGTLTLSGLKTSDITLQNVDELILYADSNESSITSIAYSKFHLGYIKSLVIQGIGKGWINENFFYGGRIEKLLFADGGEYNHNNNHFYDSTFEKATIEFFCGKGNYIHNARLEGAASVTFHKKASNNYVHMAWVGKFVPGSMLLPSWWIDESNNNYFSYGVQPAVNVYEKTLTADSCNYNADQAYPQNGRLHVKAGSFGLIETNRFSVEHSVGVVVESNKKFFRGEILLYDANGDRIREQPEYSPIGGITLKWENDRYVLDASRKTLRFTLSRNTVSGGIDTGVSAVKIVINGYAETEIDYLRFSVTAPWYVTLKPFKEDKLVATEIPAIGDWENTTVCYNIGDGEQNAWIYRNDQWHPAF